MWLPLVFTMSVILTCQYVTSMLSVLNTLPHLHLLYNTHTHTLEFDLVILHWHE